MTISFKKALISSVFIAGLLIPSAPVSAQMAPYVGYCPSPLMNNLYYGIRSNDVVTLQNFLGSNGYFPYAPVGIFGPLTFRAVQSFQVANGIPGTGYVGILTRAAINARQNCAQPIPPVVPPIQTPYIQSVTPPSGFVGTTVTLSGYGLYGNNTIYFGGSSLGNYSSNNGVGLTFTVPEYITPCPPGLYCIMMARQVTPGAYSIYIQNQNGTSNTVNFTVTGQMANQPPSITGIDAPAALRAGQSGTWTVRATLPNYTTGSNLRYSVTWGDEGGYPTAGAYSTAQSVQTSGTFSHTYAWPGQYTATFTVTNDAGQSATASASVVVTY